MNTVSFKMIRAYIVFSKVVSILFVSQCLYIFKKTSSLKGVVLRSCITKRPLLHRDAGGGQQTKIRCVYGQYKHSSSQNQNTTQQCKESFFQNRNDNDNFSKKERDCAVLEFCSHWMQIQSDRNNSRDDGRDLLLIFAPIVQWSGGHQDMSWEGMEKHCLAMFDH